VNGFGWNFYGFFIFCFVWIAGYFLWARSRQRAERKRGVAGAGGGAPAQIE
jgi:hypothetical protein